MGDSKPLVHSLGKPLIVLVIETVSGPETSKILPAPFYHLLVSSSKFYALKGSVPVCSNPMESVTFAAYLKNNLFYHDIPGSDVFTGAQCLRRVKEFKSASVLLDLILFTDLSNRAEMHGILEWLSFYFKSPLVKEGLYPENDLFVQRSKLENTLRYLAREDLIHHTGLNYYYNIEDE